jgi:hypothetical protein
MTNDQPPMPEPSPELPPRPSDAPPSKLTPPPSESGIMREVGKWSVAFVLFWALSAMLVSLQLFQLTAEGTSKQTLRRSVAALTEIDPLLDRHYDALQQQAQSAAPGDTLALPDFPVPVVMTREEVVGASRDDIRDLLLDRSADIMYDRGTDPLRSSAAGGDDAGFFSIAGLTDHGLVFLRDSNHDILGVLTFSLAAVCGVLAVALVALCRGFGRLVSVGGVVVAAAIPVVLGGIGARFYMRIVSDNGNDYMQHEFLEIGQALAWIPIRDGIAFLVLGLAFLAVGVACARWADTRGKPSYGTARSYAR